MAIKTQHPAFAAKTVVNDAPTAYTARLAQVEAQMAMLQKKLQDHGFKAANDSGNWGYVGDLGSLSELLDEALRRI